MDFSFSFSYKKRKPLFKNFSIHIEDNRINVICGHNGAGKTTLLKVLSGFLPSDLQTPSGWLIPVSGGLIQEFTLQEHLDLLKTKRSASMQSSAATQPLAETADLAAEAFSLFNAADFASSRISRLSTGQTTMAAVIVALASDASFLLLDEPFSGLDPVNADKLAAILKKSGRTIVVTSHDLYMTSEIADEIRILKDSAVTWSWSRTDADALTVDSLKEKYAQFA